MALDKLPDVTITVGGAVADRQQQERVVTTPRYSVLDTQTNTVTFMSSRDEAISSPAPSSQDEQKFRRLANQWQEETFLSSSITNNLSHPAYLRIMAMGEKVIPLILRELKERGGHWFMALRYIVNEDENPVLPEHNGKIKLMREDWLEWGRRNRYL